MATCLGIYSVEPAGIIGIWRHSIKRAHWWMHILLDRAAIVSALQHAMQLKQVSIKSSLYDLSINV